jgi:ribosomal protein L40E
MQCASCKAENPERAKFCLECGTQLSHRRTACGAELPGKAKFCLECGKPVRSGPVSPAPDPRSYTPGREDPDLAGRPRRRAQAGDGAVR